MPYSPTDKETQDRVQAFKEELRNRGWTEGVNVQFDERWTMDNMDLIRAAAANRWSETGCRCCRWRSSNSHTNENGRSVPIIVPGGTSPVERGWVKSCPA